MSDTNQQSRPRPNGGRQRKRRQGESPVWVDEDERRGKAAAMRGRSQPVSERYQRFIEQEQGQQRLFPEGAADDADEASPQLDREAGPMAANIYCTVCGARPYPPPGFREDFDLMKISPAGRPAEGDQGEWYCSRHYKRSGPLSYRIVKETDDAPPNPTAAGG